MISVLLSSCFKNDNLEKNSKGLLSIKYDKIEYYHLDISLKDANERFRKNPEKYKVWEIFYENIPRDLKDSDFISVLESNYDKYSVPKNRNRQISETLHYKIGSYDFPACDTFFRDIIVFKKGSKITGVIKICMECKISRFVGFNYDKTKYRIEIDLKKLEDILIRPAANSRHD